jgi:hypothetical protein
MQAPPAQTLLVHGFESLQSAETEHGVQPGTGTVWQPRVGLQLSVVQAFPSLQLSGSPGAQTPDWQISLPLQALLSEHPVPFRTGSAVQPKSGLQLSSVHGFESSQLTAVPAPHVPSVQLSLPLQTLPSEHDVPFRTATARQPATASQESVVHRLPSLQTRVVPAVQAPALHVSLPLQRVASGQAVPLATGVALQPEVGRHASFEQGFRSLQTSAVPAVQMPDWHVSMPLQRLPSLHWVPLVTTAFVQTPALHVSMVQGLLSLQSKATVHEVQPTIGACAQPLTVLQVSVVQALLSLQLRLAPGAQRPD